MKVLFYQWNAFMQKGIENAFKRMTIEYDIFFYQFADGESWEKDEIFVDKFAKSLNKCGYDAVLSVNYVPLISNICEEKGVPYISWVYDSPIHIRNLETMHNRCNRIYFFDRGQAEEYQRMGYENVYHMPLAVDGSVYEKMIQTVTTGDCNKYQSDISLVGQLYQSDFAYLCGPLDEYDCGFLEGVINAQLKIYGGYFLDKVITDKVLERLNDSYRRASGNTFTLGKRELEYTLACEITGRERYMALALLSKRYGTSLYSKDQDSRLSGVNFRGYVDYYSQMPKVFSLSNINLNISLKTIRTGIPLRILDVMGCGGFVLTNYQEELLEWFTPGEDIVIYESLEDLVEKTTYYMEHEEQRKSIAWNGYEKVKREFDFESRLRRMFEDIGE